jgi:hypothetical protein
VVFIDDLDRCPADKCVAVLQSLILHNLSFYSQFTFFPYVFYAIQVVFIDDLDRCPADKCVAVLQSLILLCEGTPFIIFLAIDPRVGKASAHVPFVCVSYFFVTTFELL